MPDDAASQKASNSTTRSQRRQNTSCDPCRRSKRRCVVATASAGISGKTCANCERLGHQCTFQFAESQSVSFSNKRQKRQRNDTSGSNRDIDLSDIDGTIVDINRQNDQFDPTLLADQDVLSAWLNLDFDDLPGGDALYHTPEPGRSTPCTESLSEPIQVAECGVENELTLHTTGYPKIENRRSYIIPATGISSHSPIYLLNSGMDAKILGDRLTRIYEAIATASASRYLDYDCNLLPSRSSYRISESMSDGSNESVSARSSAESQASPSSFAKSISLQYEAGQEISLLGSVRFLDHFGDLYGNRLSFAARKKSDEALKAVLRAFSMQWLPSTPSMAESGFSHEDFLQDPTPAPAEENSLNSFIDAWYRARSLLHDAHDVKSFRIILATLTFVGIVTPTKIIDKEGLAPSNLLNTALRKLCHLDRLVTNYCTNLGPSSMYGSLAEASLSIIRWTGYIRDTGAALSMNHRSKLPEQWGPAKVDFNKEAIAGWATCQNIPELDVNVQSLFRKASAETFYIWRQIINVKESTNSTHSTPAQRSQSIIDAINSAVTAIGQFKTTYQSLILHCTKNFGHLSTCPRISIVSHAMFWNLGIFYFVDVYRTAAEALGTSPEPHTGSIIRGYQHDAVSIVAQVVECVLELPGEELFNLQNGLGAEVPITAYHVTPSLAVTALRKAIESVIDLQAGWTNQNGLADTDERVLVPDGIWDRQIDILMKGLMSLDVTIGGSQTCGLALRDLMSKYGDILCECWTSGFDT